MYEVGERWLIRRATCKGGCGNGVAEEKDAVIGVLRGVVEVDFIDREGVTERSGDSACHCHAHPPSTRKRETMFTGAGSVAGDTDDVSPGAVFAVGRVGRGSDGVGGREAIGRSVREGNVVTGAAAVPLEQKVAIHGVNGKGHA